MEFQVTLPFHDNSSMKELGVGACVFVSGGLASYILFHYFPTISDAENNSYIDLADQMNELRNDIKKLKSRLASALGEFTRGVIEIKTSNQKLSDQMLINPDLSASTQKASFYSVKSLTAPRESSVRQEPTSRRTTATRQDPTSRRTTATRQDPASRRTTATRQESALQQESVARLEALPEIRESDVRRASFDTTDDEDDFVSATDVIETEAEMKEGEALKPVFQQVDKLCIGTEADREKAMALLEEEETAHPNNWRLKWRLARAHLAIYGESDDFEVKRMHAQTALKYAQEALDLNQTSADVHKWYAVCLAANLDFKSVEEKNADCQLVKKHIDIAIELDPLEPMPLFIKGKWCWGIYKLKWIEKKLTGALYGAPPHVSVEEIIDSFMKAEDLAPGFYKANRLFLGKCYYEKQDFDTSKDWLSAALTLPINNVEDARLQQDIHDLLDTCEDRLEN